MEEIGPYLKPGGAGYPSFAGISRSTTIVTAYVMTVTGLGWRDVLEAIKATRPIANPNPGFRQQLEEFGWGSSRKVGLGQRQELGRAGRLFPLELRIDWKEFSLCFRPTRRFFWGSQTHDP